MPDLILSWGDVPPIGAQPGGYGTELNASTTVATGGVGGIDITVATATEEEGATAFSVNQVNYNNPGEGIPEQSALKLFYDGVAPVAENDTMTTSLIFGANDPLYQDSVTDVSFRLFDVDAGDINDQPSDASTGSPHTDIVTIRAYDADGNLVPVVFTPGSDISMSGNTLTGNPDTDGESPDASISSLVEIAGPVSRIEIDYNNGGFSTQEILISDILMTTIDRGPNDDPIAVDDAFTTDADTDATFNVLTNDSDPDLDTVTLTSVSPGLGSVTFTPTGDVVYTPPPGFVGTDTLTYTISDGNGGTDIGEVTVTVELDVNDPPVAVDDTATTPVNTLVSNIDVLGNDTDADPGDTLTLVPGSATSTDGTVSENPDGTLNFTPNLGFTGPATVIYTVTDGEEFDNGTLTVTVTPPVNAAPVANDDTANTPFDTLIENIDVLGNDTDADPGDTLTLVPGSATSPNGTVTENADGTLDFDPTPGFTGPATITYTVTDGTDTDTGTLTVTVAPEDNDPPVAVDDAAQSTPIDTAITGIDVLSNDSDPDGDPLTVTAAVAPNGTVSINLDGTLDYQPDLGFVGSDTITYTISDNISGTDTAEVVVSVIDPSANNAPLPNNDIASTPVDTLLDDLDVLGNDTDPNGDPLTVTSAIAPNGTVTINGDGTLDYLPDSGFEGTDIITYVVDDGNGNTAPAEVIVTVGTAPTNEAPIAVDDADQTTPVDTFLANIDVIGNDSDPDGDPIDVIDGTALNGTVTINGDNTINYQPNAGFVGEDTITYQITDHISGNDTAVLTVTVGSPNTNPDADPDTSATTAGTPVTVFPLGNDTDPEGDPLTITAATAPNGTVTISVDGTSVEYTPNPGFDNDVDTITYAISDGNGGTDTSTIQVVVGTPALDGVVEGTGVGEYIGVDDPTTGAVDPYLGDPQGDQVDNSDAIDPEAGANDDVIDAGAGDDTIEAGDGNDYIEADEGDDIVDAGDGDDTVIGGDGSDSIDTGDGNDSVLADDGGSPDFGNDTVTTGNGNDTVGTGLGDDVIDTSGSTPLLDNAPFPSIPVDANPDDDRDFVDADEGNDLISTGDDADTIIGGEGNDTINPGIDNDSVIADGGDDLINDEHGADTVDGGDGDDTINVGINTFSDYVGDDPNLPITDSGITFVTDPDRDDSRDLVFGGAGNDVINTGDDADTIDGGADNDTINAGIDDDSVLGGSGDDSILGGHGSDTILGGEGNDFIDAGHTGTPGYIGDVEDALEKVGLSENDRDSIEGGLGDDTIIGGDDDDTIRGGVGNDSIDGGIDEDLIFGDAGNDFIEGGAGSDTIEGGTGDDTVTGGAGADSINTGDGQDSIVGASVGDTVDGGSGGPIDFDVLDLRGAGEAENAGGRITIDYDAPGSEGGTVNFLDAGDLVTGTMRFDEIENVIPCFTPGTLIATPTGERKVEDLQVGDRVITRDNGIQEIRWCGAKDLSGAQLAANDHMQPILIQAGALGDNLPERDILVSPQHRMLLTTDKAAMFFEEREVLVAAKHLTILDGVDQVESSGTTYIHIMFEQHEVVLSNGTWSESFQPGDYTLDGIGQEQRDEILELFPELATQQGTEAYQAARRTLKKYEAALLLG